MQLAEHDAETLVDGFTLPSGASRSASEPSGTPPALNAPAQEIGASSKVARTGWWVVDTPVDTTLSWIEAHNSAEHGFGTVSFGGATGPAYRAVTFTKPPTTSLVYRTLLVAVAPLSQNRSVVRLDVEDVYRPTKPATEVVPSSAYLVATVTRRLIPNVPNPSPFTVNVTDQAKIAQIAQLINVLPALPNEARSCPADLGPRIDLAFESAPNGTTLATVKIHGDGCEGVLVTVGGKDQPPLDPGGVNYPGGLNGRIAAILGVTLWPWNLLSRRSPR